jgi:hypothetical protein
MLIINFHTELILMIQNNFKLFKFIFIFKRVKLTKTKIKKVN